MNLSGIKPMSNEELQKSWDDVRSGKTKTPKYIKLMAKGMLGIMKEQDRRSIAFWKHLGDVLATDANKSKKRSK
jgi:hypothetical protein